MVILSYNRVGDDLNPDISIRLSQFKDHIRELVQGDYTVLSLNHIAQALKAGKDLPDKSVAITFETNHKSITQNAIPVLEDHQLPYTIFVSGQFADQKSGTYMNWRDLRNLQTSKLANFGIHPYIYKSFTGENIETIRAQINQSRVKFRTELNFNPTLFAYPYGEYDAQYLNVITEQGFEAAFAQNSSVAYTGQNLLTLPRFVITEKYGDLERFKMLVNALPLGAYDIEPSVSVISEYIQSAGFSVPQNLSPKLDQLSCFISGQEKPEIEILGDTRIELRFKQKLNIGRNRMNCTLPEKTNDPEMPIRWRWLGMLLVVKEDL